MDRGKKALYNFLASVASQFVTMICGFILPRLILGAYGSSYNGITSSITQFLSVIALLRAGVGGATRASLYRSLEKKDTKQISATIKATEIFMRKVALVFLAMVVVFSMIYPYFVRDEFEWVFSSTLVLVISLSTFVQYFFGITYQFLLQADQRQYVTAILEIITIILNTVISAILINIGVGIHGVKLGSALAFSITPIALNILARKQYNLDRGIKPDFSSISQRWDAFFHQLAAFIHSNTDIVLLTLFTNTKEISVYTVYYLVANGLKRVMNTFVVGVESAFGNIIAKQEMNTLQCDVIHYETLLHFISTILFGAAFILITPFVQVYTNGITDVNYIRYLFGYLAIIGELLFCLRSPYEALVNAAGHYKQTKKYALMEACINIIISIPMVIKLGLVGVVIGTDVAILFRTIVFGFYVSKKILHRKIGVIIKRLTITGITLFLIYSISLIIPILEMTSFYNWVLYAVEITVVSVTVTLLINMVFYKEDLSQLIKKLIGIVLRVVGKK